MAEFERVNLTTQLDIINTQRLNLWSHLKSKFARKSNLKSATVTCAPSTAHKELTWHPLGKVPSCIPVQQTKPQHNHPLWPQVHSDFCLPKCWTSWASQDALGQPSTGGHRSKKQALAAEPAWGPSTQLHTFHPATLPSLITLSPLFCHYFQPTDIRGSLHVFVFMPLKTEEDCVYFKWSELADLSWYCWHSSECAPGKTCTKVFY